MLLNMKKIASDITGNKLKFVGDCYANVLKLKGFIMNQIQNLCGMD